MVQKLKVKTMRTVDVQQEEPCPDELISISGDSRQCPRLSEALVFRVKQLSGNQEKMQIWNVYAD